MIVHFTQWRSYEASADSLFTPIVCDLAGVAVPQLHLYTVSSFTITCNICEIKMKIATSRYMFTCLIDSVLLATKNIKDDALEGKPLERVVNVDSNLYVNTFGFFFMNYFGSTTRLCSSTLFIAVVTLTFVSTQKKRIRHTCSTGFFFSKIGQSGLTWDQPSWSSTCKFHIINVLLYGLEHVKVEIRKKWRS